MAWDHQGQLVGAVGLRHGPEGGGPADPLGQLPVGDRRPGRYPAQLAPYVALELAPDGFERRLEGRALAGEVFCQLPLDVLRDGCPSGHDGGSGLQPPELGLEPAPLNELQQQQRVVVGDGQHGAERRVQPCSVEGARVRRAGRCPDDPVEG